jgi:acetyl-CoA acetyltransferase
MRSPLTDGGAAVIVCTRKGHKRMGGPTARAVKVASTAIATATTRGPTEFEKSVCRRAASLAYERAGLGPKDVHVAEIHDATAMGEIIVVENVGFAELGMGVCEERRDFSVGGRLPVNPSGGLESKGHPIGATGLGQLFELVTQLRGEAGPRQVEGAKVALQETGGGSVGYEEGVITVTILET